MVDKPRVTGTLAWTLTLAGPIPAHIEALVGKTPSPQKDQMLAAMIQDQVTIGLGLMPMVQVANIDITSLDQLGALTQQFDSKLS